MKKLNRGRTRKNIGLIFILTGALAVIIAASLLIYVEITDRNANEFCQETLVELDILIEENAAETEASEDSDYIWNWDLLSTLDVDGASYIGVLIIPDLGLELPVQDTWSYAQLKNTPCVYAGSLAEDNTIIAAHNYESHFGNIGELEIGSSVMILAVSGVVLEYEVIEIELVDETEVEYVEDGEWDLILFTCNVLNNSQRVVVRCQRE